ncbi:MAG: protease inhibitor Inh/omp19 family protein [Rhizobiaceae bacterium]|nr:protease inhibitor Inh/omp19 family protein [Rhizobiaceae bacterium]
MTKTGILAVTVAALALAGCSSARFSPLNTRSTTMAAPLEPAPAGTVTAGQLPPPGGAPLTDPSGFPEAPTGVENTQPIEVAAANAPELTPGAVAGVWNATVAGQGCRVATPQTKFGKGFRAGPLRCPAPLDGVKSWNVEGKQLALYDQNGGVLARLYSSGTERFDGQTSGGLPIALSR